MCAGITICFFIMSAKAITAPSGSRSITSSMMRWYAISCRPSSAAIMPQILPSISSPCSLAKRAVLPCEIFVARSWKEVYTKPRYGLFSVLGFMPAPMRFWMVVSTGFMSTLPVSHRYLFIRSPWRFSSAVHLRVHTAHGVSSAPVLSLVPSRVLSMPMYVGSASSVIMSPTSTTRCSSGILPDRFWISLIWSKKSGELGSGR
mmetsp:Transcript_23592/g.57819  ORF Transcript_23592/g.57819 Transcript_23592/m.57819 type:complete len:203 (-) Transcript_23592:649-1257(-)